MHFTGYWTIIVIGKVGIMSKIRINVNNTCDLVDYLVDNSDYSKSKIKSFFKYRKIFLNNHVVDKLPIIVQLNDVIEINLDADLELPFEILYEDNEILVINKPAGLLTIGTLKESENTLYRLVKDYASQRHFLVFIVHRLDRETSGVIMFAKNERMKRLYQDNWNELVVRRGYIAVVEGKVLENGRIDNFLFEEGNTFVHSSKIGKRAITNYEVIKNNRKYSLLNINIETGRKNQIRVHMKEIGHPIVGDKKYGSKHNPIRRMALHAQELIIKHPITRKILSFRCEYPKEFNKLVK